MDSVRGNTAQTGGALTIRHILVVAAGLLICLGPCGIVYNTWSIFVVPVSSDLGAASSQFTFYITIIYLVGALTAPIVGNLMDRLDLRVVLSASVLFVFAGLLLCSFWTEIWQFYISGLLEGLGMVALMFLAIPTLVNRWFAVRTGFIIGLCMSMSGVGGALWSLVGGVILAGAGWRTAYLVFAFITLVIALPATLFFVRSYPREVGLQVYGLNDDTQDASKVSDERQWGVSASTMFKSPAFYLLMLSMGIFNALTVVGNLFASYIHHLGSLGVAGITAESAVLLASSVAACLMVTAAISKVALGALSDKTAVGALLVACGCGAGSILLMWFGASTATIYVGAVLGGVLYAAIDSLSPSLTRQISGPRDYTKIYSRVAVFVNIAGAVSATAFAAVAEISWEAEWIMALALIATAFICAFVALRLSRGLERTFE